MWKNGPDASNQPAGWPLVIRQAFKLFIRRIRSAHVSMWTPTIVVGLISYLCAKRFPVQNRKVIVVKVTVVGYFPVGSLYPLVFRIVPVIKTELRQQ